MKMNYFTDTFKLSELLIHVAVSHTQWFKVFHGFDFVAQQVVYICPLLQTYQICAISNALLIFDQLFLCYGWPMKGV